ncbi:MAG: protein translocase subunit SecF [Bdellovibrionales bacterium]
MTSKLDKKSSGPDPGKINFNGLAKIFVPLSAFLVIASLVAIFTIEFQYGVEFAGGTEVQVQFQQPLPAEKLRSFMNDLGYQNASIQSFEKGNEFLIRIDPVHGATEKETNAALQDTIKKLTEGLSKSFSGEQPSIQRVDTVGPQVGSELKRNGILAAFYSLLMILVYIGLRFDYKYAPGAVFCLFHDSILILGLYSIFRWEMNVQIMAAVLTIIGYSMNDTIVVFDRIRENEKLYRDKSFAWVSNRSMNDVLTRTILTSLTTFFSVVIMWALAGGVIRDFAMTMAIGIIIGSYSTIFVATPLVIWFDKLERSKQRA